MFFYFGEAQFWYIKQKIYKLIKTQNEAKTQANSTIQNTFHAKNSNNSA